MRVENEPIQNRTWRKCYSSVHSFAFIKLKKKTKKERENRERKNDTDSMLSAHFNANIVIFKAFSRKSEREREREKRYNRYTFISLCSKMYNITFSLVRMNNWISERMSIDRVLKMHHIHIKWYNMHCVC